MPCRLLPDARFVFAPGRQPLREEKPSERSVVRAVRECGFVCTARYSLPRGERRPALRKAGGIGDAGGSPPRRADTEKDFWTSGMCTAAAVRRKSGICPVRDCGSCRTERKYGWMCDAFSSAVKHMERPSACRGASAACRMRNGLPTGGHRS